MRDLKKEILPLWHSDINWGLREAQPGSTRCGHTAELPSPVLPQLTGSFPQVINQRFRMGLNRSHTATKEDQRAGAPLLRRKNEGTGIA